MKSLSLSSVTAEYLKKGGRYAGPGTVPNAHLPRVDFILDPDVLEQHGDLDEGFEVAVRAQNLIVVFLLRTPEAAVHRGGAHLEVVARPGVRIMK